MEAKQPVNVHMRPGTRMKLATLGITLQAPSPDPETGGVSPIPISDKGVLKFLLRYPGTARLSAQECVDKGWLESEEVRRLGYPVKVVVLDEKGKPAKDKKGEVVTEILEAALSDDPRLPPGTPDFPKMTILELREYADDFIDVEGNSAPVHLPQKASKDELVERLEDAVVQRDKALSVKTRAASGKLPTNADPRKAR